MRFHRLLRAFGSPEKALAANPGELSRRIKGLSPEVARKILATLPEKELACELAQARQLGVKLLPFRDPRYPANLLPCYEPAPLLYIWGDLKPEDSRAVAVVGTRQPTEYGRRMAVELATGLVKRGYTVVSGLARGVDTLAHRAALEAGGRTLAVLGSGLAHIYPPENKELAQGIAAKGGAVISQFRLEAEPERFHFPMRNAVISGLALGVVVVEGEEDSGSLITADLALDQGREVFAVPGPVDSPKSAGPLKLIQQGAKLVRGVQDIVEELEPLRPGSANLELPLEPGRSAPSKAKGRVEGPVDSKLSGLTGEESRVHAVLRLSGKTHIDRLAGLCRLPAGKLSAVLTLLEIKEAIRQLPGKIFEAL